MFKISHIEYDDPHKEYSKIHYASTLEIAEEVKRDLENRFGPMELVEEEGNNCKWDPGGMMMTDDKTFYFPLTNCTLMCKAQHFEYFVESVQRYAPRGNATKYVKLHSAYFCICISPEEFEKLKVLMTDGSLMARAQESWERREKKLISLMEQQLVVRAIDIDGQLHVINPVAETDTKKLN